MLKIEAESFPDPWTEEDFLRWLRKATCIGKVAEIDGQIVGFLLFDLKDKRIDILRMATARDCRRMYVGQQMVDERKLAVAKWRRRELRVCVRESHLGAQLFFRSQGFRAVAIDRGHYEDTEESAYVMRFRLGEELALPTSRNRISAYMEDE